MRHYIENIHLTCLFLHEDKLLIIYVEDMLNVFTRKMHYEYILKSCIRDRIEYKIKQSYIVVKLDRISNVLRPYHHKNIHFLKSRHISAILCFLISN